MKLLKLTSLITGLLSFIILSSCSESSSNDNSKTNIISNIQVGNWRITKFIDSGTDETNHFTGYIFQFMSSGTLNANNGTNNYNGNWSITDSSNDDSPDDLDFNINFNLTNDFEDLNDDWDIMSHNSVKIALRDVSGGNDDVDYLTFEKN